MLCNTRIYLFAIFCVFCNNINKYQSISFNTLSNKIQLLIVLLIGIYITFSYHISLVQNGSYTVQHLLISIIKELVNHYNTSFIHALIILRSRSPFWNVTILPSFFAGTQDWVVIFTEFILNRDTEGDDLFFVILERMLNSFQEFRMAPTPVDFHSYKQQCHEINILNEKPLMKISYKAFLCKNI